MRFEPQRQQPHRRGRTAVAAGTLLDTPRERALVSLAFAAQPLRAIDRRGHGLIGEAVLWTGELIGQTFQMAMYHPNHPGGGYERVNRVQAFDPPSAISREPGQDTGHGKLSFGGRGVALRSHAGRDSVRKTWDAASAQFPPFPPDHLVNSLVQLAQLAT